MRTTKFKVRTQRFGAEATILAAFLLVCLAVSTPARGQDPCKNNPLNGKGPGGNGGAGKNGDDDKVKVSPSATATADDAQDGGCGEPGRLNGTAGGRGGKGGDATADATAGAGNNTAKATGGTGGHGGKGGISRKQTAGNGADGGAGGAAIATATSTGGSASAQATSGNGGDGGDSTNLNRLIGGDGGNGKDGGRAVATATAGPLAVASIATAKAGDGGKGGSAGGAAHNGGDAGNGGNAEATAKNGLLAIATATGGNGKDGGSGGSTVVVGEKGGNGGNGGNGGTAEAIASGCAVVIANATGGKRGGGGLGGGAPKVTDRGKTGAPGKNGSATADATASCGSSPALASANAKGGGLDGDATAKARATSKTAAVARANALGGNKLRPGGKADATATATSQGLAASTATSRGSNGTASSRTVTIGGAKIPFLSTQADAPAKNDTAVALSRSVIGGPSPDRSLLSGVQAGVLATGEPLASDVTAAAASDPNVRAGLQIGAPTTNVFGLVAMGGSAPSDAPGTSETYSSSAAFEVNLSRLNGELRVGLLDPLASGANFDSLTFDIFKNGSLFDSWDFTSESSALSFFHDDVLDLGPIRSGGGTGPLDLQFNFGVTAQLPGAGFNSDFLVASVGNTTSPTPEPGSLLLLGSALLILSTVLRRQLLVPRPTRARAAEVRN